MAQKSLGDMVVRIVGENAEFDNSIDKSEKKLVAFEGMASKVGKTLSLALTAPIVAAGVASVKSSAQIEMLQTSFEVFLGSSIKAKGLMNDIIDLAAKTPYVTTGLASGAKMLLQYGVSAEQIIPTLKMLGDVSSGNQETFNRLSYAYGQIMTLGRLTGQDLKQLTEAGFNPLNIIAQKTGESMEVLRDKMSKGEISARQVAEAFKIATSEGGKFFQGAEKGSLTLNGLISTLRDNVEIAARSFSDEFIPSLKDTVKWASDTVTKIGQLDKSTKAFILTIVGFTAALGPLALGIKAVTAAVIAFQANPIGIGLTAAAIAAYGLVAAFTALKKSADVKFTESQFRSISDKLKSAAFNGEDLEKTIKRISNETGIAVSKVADIATEAKLVTSENEQQVGKLVDQNKELDKTKQKYTDIFKLNQLIENSLRLGGQSGVDINNQLEQLAVNTGISKERIIAIGLESKNVSTEYKEQLQLLKDQLVQQDEKTAYEDSSLRNNVNIKLSLAEQKKAADDRLLVERKITEEQKKQTDKKYLAAREMVLSILEDEKTEYQKIQDTIDELSKTPWAAGKLEDDRLKAVELLKNRQLTIARETAAEQVQTENDRIEKQMSKEQELLDDYNRIQDEKVKADKKAQDEITKKQEEESKKREKYINTNVDLTLQYLSAVTNAYTASYDKRIKDIENERDREIESLKVKYDANLITQEEYNSAVEALEDAAAKKTEELEYKSELASWKNNRLQTIAAGIRAVVETYKNAGGWPFGIIPAGIMAGITAKQMEALEKTKPTPPALAEGALIMPKAGGTNVTVAEAGIPEIVGPIDKVTEMLKAAGNNTIRGSDSGMQHLTLNMDSKTILDKIFPATKNRTILIHAGAVVG